MRLLIAEDEVKLCEKRVFVNICTTQTRYPLARTSIHAFGVTLRTLGKNTHVQRNKRKFCIAEHSLAKALAFSATVSS